MSLSPAESRATPAGRRRFAPSALTTSLTQQQLIHSPAVIRQSLRPWLATMAPDVYTDSTQDHMRREIAHKWHWQLRSHHTHIQAYSTRKHRSHQRPQQSPITHMPRDVRCTVAHAYGTQARFRGLFGGLGGSWMRVRRSGGTDHSYKQDARRGRRGAAAGTARAGFICP